MHVKTLASSLLLACGLLAGTWGAAQAAETFPTKSVQMIVPYNAGGDTDLVGRIIAKELQTAFKKPVVVVNVNGGAGSIGATKVKDSTPDGYTALFHHSGLLLSSITESIPFSYKDMTMVGSVALSEGSVWVVNSNSPYKNLQDLIKAAKEKPGTLKNGVNLGSQSHTHGVALEKAADIQLHNVDVGGIAEKNVALLGGHIDVTETQVGAVLGYLKSGRMRVIGTPAARRYAGLPDVPTFKEQGVDLTVPDRIFFITLPPNTPQAVVDAYAAALRQVSASKTTSPELDKIMITPYFRDAKETLAYLDEENAFLSQYKDILLSGKKK